jgi:PTS system nitrogen regulatory IIA component
MTAKLPAAVAAVLPDLDVEDILLDLPVRDQPRLFEAIAAQMERRHGIPATAVATALQRREAAGSTALGQGVAIPHARVQGLKAMRLVYARLQPGLGFDAPDGAPVTDVVALMVPTPATQAHLDALAEIVALFSDREFGAALRSAHRADQVWSTFVNWPRHAMTNPKVLARR